MRSRPVALATWDAACEVFSVFIDGRDVRHLPFTRNAPENVQQALSDVLLTTIFNLAQDHDTRELAREQVRELRRRTAEMN